MLLLRKIMGGAAGRPAFGQYWDDEGGLVGAIDYNRGDAIGTLVVAPASTRVQRVYAQRPTYTYAFSAVNGLLNTNAIVSSGFSSAATYAAGYCDQLVYGGKSDWYSPTTGECAAIGANKAAFTGSEDLTAANPWTSMEADASANQANAAYVWGFTNNNRGFSFKDVAFAALAIRFVPNA